MKKFNYSLFLLIFSLISSNAHTMEEDSFELYEKLHKINEELEQEEALLKSYGKQIALIIANNQLQQTLEKLSLLATEISNTDFLQRSQSEEHHSIINQTMPYSQSLPNISSPELIELVNLIKSNTFFLDFILQELQVLFQKITIKRFLRSHAERTIRPKHKIWNTNIKTLVLLDIFDKEQVIVFYKNQLQKTKIEIFEKIVDEIENNLMAHLQFSLESYLSAKQTNTNIEDFLLNPLSTDISEASLYIRTRYPGFAAFFTAKVHTIMQIESLLNQLTEER